MIVFGCLLEIGPDPGVGSNTAGNDYLIITELFGCGGEVAQGGDALWLEKAPTKPAHIVPIISPVDGYITAMDTAAIGSAAVILGAGRSKKDDPIDYSAGITAAAKTGDRVEKGMTLGTLYTNEEAAIQPATERYLSALSFGENPPESTKLIYEIIR